jgi:hypothetical protein
MPIPALTDYGLLPPGEHACTRDEIYLIYCANNDNRRTIWESFVTFLDNEERTFAWPNEIYVDGGFTSDKPVTKDIDVVLDISHLDDRSSFLAITWWLQNQKRFFDQFKVDFWLKHAQMGKDLKSFFCYVKPAEQLQRQLPNNTQKGILRMAL